MRKRGRRLREQREEDRLKKEVKKLGVKEERDGRRVNEGED